MRNSERGQRARRCAVELLGGLGLFLVIAGCAPQPPQPVVAAAPRQICPPDPPAGFRCAPPIACRIDPKIQALDAGPLGALLPANLRDAIMHGTLLVADLCR